MANGKPPQRPRKAPQAKNAGSELGETLEAVAKLAKAAGIVRARRTTSQNPARMPINKTMRVHSSDMPTAKELFDRTGPSLGTGARAARVQVLPTADEQLGQNGLITAEELMALSGGEGMLADQLEVDRTEYLSPPPSNDPSRPRTRASSYNPDTQVLTVTFRNGGTYQYFGVPRRTWGALKRNRSFGQTMDRLVINQYPYEKVAF